MAKDLWSVGRQVFWIVHVLSISYHHFRACLIVQIVNAGPNATLSCSHVFCTVHFMFCILCLYFVFAFLISILYLYLYFVTIGKNCHVARDDYANENSWSKETTERFTVAVIMMLMMIGMMMATKRIRIRKITLRLY